MLEQEERIDRIIDRVLLRGAVRQERRPGNVTDVMIILRKAFPKSIAGHYTASGAVGLYRAEDGNAYEIEVRPVTLARWKDSWKKWTK